jgi:cytochrome P450
MNKAMNTVMKTATAVSPPEGLHWDPERNRLKVRSPALADAVLRDPHIVTGIDHGRPADPGGLPAAGETPSIIEFFQMWYTVGPDYARFSTELRKAFTTHTVEAFADRFGAIADRHLAAMPARGDLARDYLSPYFMHSTFDMIGVPEHDWPNLTKVARLVIHLFKQQLRGVWRHGDREVAAFRAAMCYLKELTDAMLDGDGTAPFLGAARRLAPRNANTWPVAALIGQLLMAGIEPMIVGTGSAYRDLAARPDVVAAARSGAVDMGEVAEEVMRQNPPFAHMFRFVAQPCDCLGICLDPGTIVAIDIAAVNLAMAPARDPAAGCPVRHSAVFTFGKGTHYCLGANSARAQVAIALRRLVTIKPALRLDADGIRIDTHNNLKEVRALPYLLPDGKDTT